MARFAWLCGLGLSTLGVAALADGPALPPAVAPAAPATQPAASAVDVFVTPFQPLADAGDLAWAGRAVQQNLVGDLARAALRPAAGDGAADPLAAARSAGARYLVGGTFQRDGILIRFNGQLTDVATGSVAAGLTATGDGRDLFALEDALSAQAVRAVRRLAGVPAAAGRPVPADLQPSALAAAVQPPAGGTGSSYDGSALQAYVDADRTPSTDYAQQVANSRDRNTFGSYTNSTAFAGGFGGFGGGGFGYGGVGGSYGFGGSGFGGYALGVSYPVTGTFGYGSHGGFGGTGGFGRGGGHR